jgi:hypothetical protein
MTHQAVLMRFPDQRFMNALGQFGCGKGGECA